MPEETNAEASDKLNHVKWAAWGVVDIEALERMQRRNYIKRARAELHAAGLKLECGGSKTTPYYAVVAVDDEVKKVTRQIAAGADAFKKICAHAVGMLEPEAHS